MSERNLVFDADVNRYGTDSLKFDHATRRGKPEGLLSYWVADMDFKISSYIQDAIRETVDHGIYGYTEPKERYFVAVSDWMKTRHGFEPREESLVVTPGVVFALAHCVRAFTAPGDAVLIQLGEEILLGKITQVMPYGTLRKHDAPYYDIELYDKSRDEPVVTIKETQIIEKSLADF